MVKYCRKPLTAGLARRETRAIRGLPNRNWLSLSEMYVHCKRLCIETSTKHRGLTKTYIGNGTIFLHLNREHCFFKQDNVYGLFTAGQAQKMRQVRSDVIINNKIIKKTLFVTTIKHYKCNYHRHCAYCGRLVPKLGSLSVFQDPQVSGFWEHLIWIR